MLGDFAVKNAKLGREIGIWLKINKVETKCTVLQIIPIVCVTHVQKNFQIWTSIKQLWTKYQIFMKLPQISHIHNNRIFLSIFATF